VPSSLDQVFSALADPTRLAVVKLLSAQALRASDVAAALDMSRPAMSRHLRVLRKAGLVEETSPEEDARVRVYRLRRDPFVELRSWAEEVEAFWTDQLQAFKAHAERKSGRRRR
jgi:DNA-binding transcriptional ArsR family regulator